MSTAKLLTLIEALIDLGNLSINRLDTALYSEADLEAEIRRIDSGTLSLISTAIREASK